MGEDIFDSPDLIAFDEAQAALREAELVPDIGAPIPAGRLVALHRVIFDGTGGRQRGRVRFSAPILGLAIQDATLRATDALAGVGAPYLGHRMRGLEPGDRAWIDPVDPTLLWVDWMGSSPGDHLRAFTQCPPLI